MVRNKDYKKGEIYMFKKFDDFIANKGNAAVDYVNANIGKIKTFTSAYQFEEFFRTVKMTPYDDITAVKKDIMDDIDNTRLTTKERDALLDNLKKDEKKVRSIVCDDYRKAMNQFTKMFKDFLIDGMPENLKSKADIIYDRAYDQGHANGFTSIASEFDDLCDFASDIIK
jgi:hypothetical protein